MGLRERANKLERLVGADNYAERLLVAFGGKIGPKPSPEELLKLHAEADRRYHEKIPPGYEDVGQKPTIDSYGDYIGWQQLMDIATVNKKHAILVIDDVKGDWWQKHGKAKDRTIGPEPRLREEFFQTTQQHVFLYTSENFLRTADARKLVSVSQAVIAEVAGRLEVQRETQQSPIDKQETAAEASPVEKAMGPGVGEQSLEKSSHPPGGFGTVKDG